jgi:uncharacterized membrane protein
MMKYLVAYLGTAVVFAASDAAWLTFAGAKLYRPALDPVLADKFALAPALVFYLGYILGIVMIVVLPAGREGSWTRALTHGAMLGAMAYGTYDLTNQATLKVWDTRITLADMGWGTLLTAVAAVAGYFVLEWASARTA